MTQNAATEQDYLIPDEVARAAVLPASYLDEEGTLYPAYAWLRANNPLGLARLENYDPLWLVTKHADVIAVERQPELFPSGEANPILNDQPSDAFIRSLTGGSIRSLDAVVWMDPPEHAKYRAIVNQWFMPRQVQKYETQIRALAREAVDRLLAIDGEFDFVNDFALNFPLHVIMTLFGVPQEEELIMLKLTQELFGVHNPEEQREEMKLDPDVAGKMWMAAIQGFYKLLQRQDQGTPRAAGRRPALPDRE